MIRPRGKKLNFPTNCAFGGPDLQTLYIANLEGDHFSCVKTPYTGQSALPSALDGSPEIAIETNRRGRLLWLSLRCPCL